MARSKFYNRVGYVVIYDSKGNAHKYGATFGDEGESNLDFKFNVRKLEGCGDRQQQATVDILGLSKDVIDKIVYWGPRTTPKNMLKKVEVYAGYEDVGAELMFSGYIFNASVSELPDMWLHLQCDNLIMETDSYTKDFKGGDIKSICSDVATHFGLKFNWDSSLYAVNTKFRDSHHFVCDHLQLHQVIEALGKLDASKKMTFYVDQGALKVCNVDKDKHPIELSVKTGLIKIDQVGYQTRQGLGIKVTARLDTIWQPGTDIALKSVMTPSVNGIWHVNEVNYTGHFRGNEWFVRLTGWASEETLKRNNTQKTETW